MKKIYSIIGILLILSILLVGCTTDNQEVKQVEGEKLVELDKDSLENEEPIQVEEEVEVVEVVEDEVEEVQESDPEIFSEKLIEIMKSKHYTMKMNTIVSMDGKQIEVQTTTIAAGDQTAVIMKSEDISMTTILKGDKAYVIMHEQKMILVAPMADHIEEPGLDEIDFSKIEYLGKGKGIFLGNERDYEEYKVDSGTVKYYFDGKEFDGMELLSEGATTIMDVEFYSEDVDMSVFELPKGYMQIGN